MDLTLNNQQRFPVGTTVKAYAATNWQTAQLPPEGSPKGASIAEATVASNGNIAFTGLAASTKYFAAAEVSSEWRYSRFLTALPKASAEGAEANIAAEKTARESADTTLGSSISIINLGTDWSSGDNVLMFSSAVTPGKLNMRDGTSASPVEVARPTAKVSRKESLTVAQIEALGGAGADGADVVAAFQAISEGGTASQTQTIGGYFGAKNASNYGEGNPDASGLYAIGNITGGTAPKASGIGATLIGRREASVVADVNGAEIVVHNRAAVGSYASAGASDTRGLWIRAAGTVDSGCAINIGNPSSLKFKVGIGVPLQNGGAIELSTFRDDGEAKRSIDIRGKHSEGAVVIGAESGFIVIGAEALTTTTTQRLEINSGATNSNPALKLTASANTTHTIKLNNTSADYVLGQSGATNGLMTGTAAGDGCVVIGNSATFHVGRSAVRASLRVSNNVAIGFNAADSFGSGKGVIFIANAETVPSANPTAGGILYCEGGALKYRGSSGTVTQIAAA